MDSAAAAAAAETTAPAAAAISNRLVRLVSKEGDAFEVELNVIAMSKLVMVAASTDDEEAGGDDAAEAQDILLPAVPTRVLARILEFARHYHAEPMTEIEKPLKDADLSKVVQQWYADFINVDNTVLVDLVNAVNYMEAKPLLTLCMAAIAARIKDQTPEQIRANITMPVPDATDGGDAAAAAATTEMTNDIDENNVDNVPALEEEALEEEEA